MTEEEKRAKEIKDAVAAADAKKLADAAETGEKLNKMLSCLDALTTGVTTIGQRMDAYDAAEKARKDAAEAAATTTEEKRKIADKARMDASAHSVEMADVQARCDAVASAFGSSAPRPLDGETVLAYRRRCLKPYVAYSDAFKAVDLNDLDTPKLLDAAEKIIFDCAIKASDNPLIPEGYMQKRVTKDASGREITTWLGSSPRAWMEQFSGIPQRLTGIRTSFPPH